MQERSEWTEVTADQVVAELARIGFSNMLDYITVQEKDGTAFVDLSALTRDQAAAISEIVIEDFKDGAGKDARDVRRVSFKLASKQSALDSLAKHLGMYIHRHEHSGKDGGPIDFGNTLELARGAGFLLREAAEGLESGKQS